MTKGKPDDKPFPIEVEDLWTPRNGMKITPNHGSWDGGGIGFTTAKHFITGKSTTYTHFEMIFPVEPLIACYISIHIYIYILYCILYILYYTHTYIYIYILDYIECGCRPRFFGAKTKHSIVQ